jgi:hypothetical protein
MMVMESIPCGYLVSVTASYGVRVFKNGVGVLLCVIPTKMDDFHALQQRLHDAVDVSKP